MPASPHPPSSPTTINSAQPRPLIVRLRNWVGDVTLALPLLERLAAAGFAPVLVGKGWARELLAGTGWPVHGLPRTASERVALLRRLREEALCAQPAFRQAPVQALCLPDSFSSALELRLAGLRAVGHAWEGRRLLLAHAVPRPRAVHELEVYWRLGQALLGTAEPPPPAVRLRPTETQLREAAALRAAHGLPERVIVICPFSGGTWNGQSKDWPAFADFVAQRLPSLGLPFVVCPSRGDEERLALCRRHAAARRRPGGLCGAAGFQRSHAVQRHRAGAHRSRRGHTAGECDGTERPDAVAPLGSGLAGVRAGRSRQLA
jgi:ADP-heptose:LPS heptosyltransferase